MRLLIWNINSLLPTIPNFKLKHGSIRGFFEEYKADVICFQETKLQSEEKLTKEVACVEGFESFWAFSRERKGYSGVAVYVSDRFSPLDAQADCLGTGECDLDREGRVLLLDLGAFVLVNVYVPNAGCRGERGRAERADLKTRFLAALKDKCDALAAAGREVLIVGDLNIAAAQQDVHAKLDREAMYSADEKALFAELLAGYRDVWRLRHPGVSDSFTVWNEKTIARVFNEGVRIDYALTTPGLLGRVASCEILHSLPPKWSDHAPLLLELENIPQVPPHAPCAGSSKRIRRFQAPKTSIASLFAAQKRAAADKGGSHGTQAAAAAAAGKLPRREGDADVAASGHADAAAAAADDAAASMAGRPDGVADRTGDVDAPVTAEGGREEHADREQAAGAPGQLSNAPASTEAQAADAAVDGGAEEGGKGAAKQPARAKQQATPAKGKKGSSKERDKGDAKQKSICSFFSPH